MPMEIAIQPLPIEVVNLIAAGEVIDSLAAVVRELAENALDAGATRITIALWPQHWRIHVTDNGSGMSLIDLQAAATAHSTSKIRDRQDLLAVGTLGFRGEALHSMAQLAQLTILSCATATAEGWQIRYDAEGDPIVTDVVAIAPGTTVMVDNLFGNWEARRQSLPAINQQLRTVQTIIQEMALAHPQVTWMVHQNDRPWFQIWPGKTVRSILPQLVRDLQVDDLVEVAETFPGGRLALCLGLPDRAHRHRPDWVKVAVNGRFIELPELQQTIIQHLRRTVPRDRFPVCLVHLQVNPDQVDWNRHPAKAELYLQHLEQWQDALKQTIDQALQITPESLAEGYQNARTQALLKTAEAEAGYNVERSITGDSSAPLIPLKAIAQVHNMYILAEHPAGMWLVEQHIAHERVLFEQISDRWELVSLEPPLIVNQLIPAQVEQLQRIGLDIAPFGENLWAVRSLPKLLAERSDTLDAVRELSLGGDLETAQVAIACRSAIRNGTPLALTEMQSLLDQWQRTKNPHTCPHGRPIYLSLEESSLSKFFRRHWVIGKSHGI
jgi:DNA mismatch repair protein MutL